jgi:anti-anti-sigma factor
MCSTVCADRALLSRPSAETTQRIVNVGDRPILVESGDDIRVVKTTGELDLGSRALVTCQCTELRARAVVADLPGLTFLDSGGYRVSVAARTTLEQHRRALVAAVGEPRRLHSLIRRIDPRGPSC